MSELLDVKPEVPEIEPQPIVRLGSLAIQNPEEVVARGARFAKVLADIIETQKLYSIINHKKYVWYEGWVTLGAILGVLPEEEYCRPLADGSGFEAKVRLFRTSDNKTCGGASAQCGKDEKRWANADQYAIRSMSITRATGKAFRLSFSWIMKLAGYEVTPAEEMQGYGDSGSLEQAQEAGQRQIEAIKAKKAKKDASESPRPQQTYTPSLFYMKTGEKYSISGDEGLMRKLWNQFKANYVAHGKCYHIDAEQLNTLQFQCQEGNIPLSQLKAAE